MFPSILPVYARADLSFVRGEGSWLFDDKNNAYLDMAAGVGVTLLGHSHPVLIEALKTQADKLWHTSNLYHIPNQQTLADILVKHTFADTAFFTNSGAEAIEGAMKIARRYHFERGDTKRKTIITCHGSFHGRTLATISAAGQHKLVDGFAPLLDGFMSVPFGDMEALRACVDDTTAAIMIEPIQGEGGIRVGSHDYLRELRELCDTHGALLILDEVQCGMGRTGRLFAHEWAGITPDIMAIAKGLGGGFPLGAVLATAEAALGMKAGTHGSTFGGNPLACAVGIAVMGVVANDGFLSAVRGAGEHLEQSLQGLVANYPDVFVEARGVGLMRGLQCKEGVEGANLAVVKRGYEERLLCVPASDNVVRLLPALNIGAEDISEAVARLELAVSD